MKKITLMLLIIVVLYGCNENEYNNTTKDLINKELTIDEKWAQDDEAIAELTNQGVYYSDKKFRNETKDKNLLFFDAFWIGMTEDEIQKSVVYLYTKNRLLFDHEDEKHHPINFNLRWFKNKIDYFSPIEYIVKLKNEYKFTIDDIGMYFDLENFQEKDYLEEIKVYSSEQMKKSVFDELKKMYIEKYGFPVDSIRKMKDVSYYPTSKEFLFEIITFHSNDNVIELQFQNFNNNIKIDEKDLGIIRINYFSKTLEDKSHKIWGKRLKDVLKETRKKKLQNI